MPLTEDERLLIEGCRTGDEDAWRVLYRAYAPDIGQFLQGMMRGCDPEELVQRVFLEFLSSLGRFRGDASLRTWLHRIARNVALNDSRSRTRRQSYLTAYADTVRERAPSHEGQIAARQQLDQLASLLDALDPVFREVWILRELQHLTVAECASVLQVEPATVRTRHHRARKRLLEMLNGPPKPQLRVLEGGGRK